MEALKNQYIEINNYLQEMEKEKERLTSLIKKLQIDNRNDEAVFEKIRLNVYNILLTYFQASYGKVIKQNIDTTSGFLVKLCEEYLSCFEKVTNPWGEQLSYAAAHNMVEEKTREEIKLESAESIKRLFIQSMEGTIK